MPRPDRRIGTMDMEGGEIVCVVYSSPRCVFACSSHLSNVDIVRLRNIWSKCQVSVYLLARSNAQPSCCSFASYDQTDLMH